MNDDTKKLIKMFDDMVTSKSTIMLGSPDTVQQLQDQGAPIQNRFVLYEEYLENLIEKRREGAIDRLGQLPQIDGSVADGVISEIYEEIRSSYALGFFTSTIVSSIFLLEYAMRATLYAKRLESDPKTEWPTLENMSMKKLIGQLKKTGLIDDKEAKQLIAFNDDLRDPYLHINIHELSEGVIITKLPGVNIKTGKKIEMRNVKASEHKFLWFAAKKFFDKYHVQPVIDFCVGWTNQLLANKKP